jgi:hypothetical protein
MSVSAPVSSIPLTHQTLLNALEGICYVCAFGGEILAVGEENWAEFASANQAPKIVNVRNVIGTSIFSHISGDDVAASYKSWFAEIRSGRSRTISFTYRCDAPDVRREMRMCLSGVYAGSDARAVLFQSLIIEERTRPWVSLFDVANLRASEAALPIVALCSYCQDIKLDERWVKAEHYYAKGGPERVRVSHGICPECHRTKVCEGVGAS